MSFSQMSKEIQTQSYKNKCPSFSHFMYEILWDLWVFLKVQTNTVQNKVTILQFNSILFLNFLAMKRKQNKLQTQHLW